MPKGWEIVQLNQVSQINSGGTPKTSKSEYYEGNIPWITPAEMGVKQDKVYLDVVEKTITQLGLEKSSAKLISAQSIVYSKRAPIGHINIVPFDFSTNQGCLSVTPMLVSNEFLYIALKNATPVIESKASGTTFKEISSTAFSQTVIPLAPLPEQKRIFNKVIEINQSLDLLD